ncbi:SARP family transcriptional regulator [Rhizocola hellebori]|uniref:SARP family transcriptional regulator n=1 Tax=Rhizocola hellebori TaxID=1392758 RepID=A0A8J3QH97_9ACTN|nr:BTAD domain-containing putative transcriptional regulator [Rhizocola hellebori]GIH10848.1 SARP family transcriptional regulator [Rhizocola hellebori]
MVQLLFLGPLEIWAADRQVAIGTGAKSLRVLAALAAQPQRTVSVELLVDAVWEDDPPPTARKQIQNAISAMRATPIGPALIARQSGYLLDVTRDQVDVSRFEDYLTEADRAVKAGDVPAVAETLQAGLRLWRGPAFAGIGGRHAEALAARLHEQRLSAVTQWAQATLELGRHGAVVEELTALAEQVPTREPLTGLLMLALYRSGRGAEAIICYHHTRQRLADELGIEPSQELRRLFEQILTSDPALAHRTRRPSRNFLPRDVAGFIGRAEELRHLVRAAMREGAIVIQAVDGMAGVGKTALAVHAAHQLAAQFPDGQLFVDLHGHGSHRDPLTSEEALEVLLRSVGVDEAQLPPDLDQKAGLWRSESAGRRLIVMLDNASTSAQVRPLLPGSAQCAVLITSRHRLVGLDSVQVVSLDPLAPADAMAMFTRIVGAARTRSEADLVLEAVRRCGFLPLAIGIVAARMRARPSWTLGHLVQRLADEALRPGLLATDDYGVTAAFSLSYRHLHHDQQHLYRLLGLHPGTEIDRYHAAALAGIPTGRAEQILEELCDAHLLTSPQAGHYRFHDLVREHARGTAAEESPAQHAQAIQRLLDYYLHVSEAAAAQISPWRRQIGPPAQHPPGEWPQLSSVDEAVAWFEAEHANLLPLARWAAEHSHAQHGWQLPRNAGTYLLRCGHLTAGATALRAAVAAAEQPGSDPRARAACLANLSLILRALGDHQAALQCLQQSLDHARATQDREGETALLTSIADIQVRLCAYHEAVDISAQAIEFFRGQDNWVRESSALSLHIDALVRLGRHGEAIQAAPHVFRLLEGRPSHRATGLLLARLASAYSQQGDQETAQDLLARAIEAARDTKDRISEADCLRRLARALHLTGQASQALKNATEALDILAESPDAVDIVETHNVLGVIHHSQGRHRQALAHYQQAASTAAKVGYRIGRAQALGGTAHTLDALGDTANARQHRQEALAIFIELDVPEAARQ